MAIDYCDADNDDECLPILESRKLTWRGWEVTLETTENAWYWQASKAIGWNQWSRTGATFRESQPAFVASVIVGSLRWLQQCIELEYPGA